MTKENMLTKMKRSSRLKEEGEEEDEDEEEAGSESESNNENFMYRYYSDDDDFVTDQIEKEGFSEKSRENSETSEENLP
mgnify:CR=1 FL=1